MENVDLEFREGVLLAIARKALVRKAGARGLRSILEHVLLDVMFDLPSMENVSKVVLDEAGSTGEIKPIVIYAGCTQSGLIRLFLPVLLSCPDGVA